MTMSVGSMTGVDRFRAATASASLGAGELRPASELVVARRALLVEYAGRLRAGTLAVDDARRELAQLSRFVEGLRRRQVLARLPALEDAAYGPLFEGPPRHATERSPSGAVMLAMRWLATHRLCFAILEPQAAERRAIEGGSHGRRG
jgi:hypothetical protein